MRVWAIANQKGGVGKTTTTLALGRGLAMRGHRVLPVSILPTLYDKRTRTGADTLKAMQDEYGERVWNDAIPNDTRICSVDALTRSSPAAQYPGRGLSAYRRALDWLLLTEARDTEQAA